MSSVKLLLLLLDHTWRGRDQRSIKSEALHFSQDTEEFRSDQNDTEGRLLSLNLGFLCYKPGVIIAPSSWSRCEAGLQVLAE